MLLSDLKSEYLFHCKCRKLSEKTIKNYEMLLRLLLDYLEREKNITTLDQLKPTHIKQFINFNDERGRKPNYLNDLLKVYKSFFKYLHEEEYTKTILTDKIKNIKKPKVIIKTFTNAEVKAMIDYYSGFDYTLLYCFTFQLGKYNIRYSAWPDPLGLKCQTFLLKKQTQHGRYLSSI